MTIGFLTNSGCSRSKSLGYYLIFVKFISALKVKNAFEVDRSVVKKFSAMNHNSSNTKEILFKIIPMNFRTI